MKKIIAGLLIWSQIAVAGKLQDADFKTEAELVSAGSSAAQLLNDSKIYVTANGINKKLSSAITAGDIGGGGSGKSYLTNSNFENTTVTTGWTITNSTPTAETTEIVEGSQSLKLALSSQTGDLLVQSVTPSIKTTGQNFEATCRIKTTLSTIQLCGLVNGAETQCASVPSGGGFVQVPINITPSDGVSFGVKVKATSSSTGNVYIDECYAGQARNIGSVVQAKLVDVVTVTGCAAAWSTTSATYANFGTQTGCTYTSKNNICTAPATNVAGIKCSTLDSGDYKIEYEGRVSETSGGISAWFRFNDGTNSSREESSLGSGAAGHLAASTGINHSISYSAPQSNVTLQVQGKTNGGTAVIYGTSVVPAVFKIWHFPTRSQQVVSGSQADFGWTSFTPTGSWVTNTTYSGKYRRVGEMMEIQYYLVLSGAPTATPLTLNIPTGYTIDSSKVFTNTSTNSVGLGTGIARDDGTNSYTVHAAYIPSTTSIGILTTGSPVATVSNTSPFTFGNLDTVLVTASVPIVGWSSNQRAPTLVGSVTTDNDTPERICRATVTASCTASPCTIANGNAGSCMTNITRSSAGVYTANFPSGKFSAVPSCFAWNYTTNRYMIGNGTGTATAFSFQTSDSADAGFTVMCMGSR